MSRVDPILHDWDVQLSPIYTHSRGRALIVEAGKMGYVYAMDAVLPSDERLVESLLP